MSPVHPSIHTRHPVHQWLDIQFQLTKSQLPYIRPTDTYFLLPCRLSFISYRNITVRLHPASKRARQEDYIDATNTLVARSLREIIFLSAEGIIIHIISRAPSSPRDHASYSWRPNCHQQNVEGHHQQPCSMGTTLRLHDLADSVLSEHSFVTELIISALLGKIHLFKYKILLKYYIKYIFNNRTWNTKSKLVV